MKIACYYLLLFVKGHFYLTLRLHFGFMLSNYIINALCGIKKLAYRCIMIERINYIGNVFTHVDVNVPRLFKETGAAVDKVCGKYL